jgi:hypothetical protein
MTGRPEATANLLKSCGARRFVESGVEGGDKIVNRLTDASTILRLLFESEKVPVTLVISNALVGYFASVPGPKVISSDPLTPGLLK